MMKYISYKQILGMKTPILCTNNLLCQGLRWKWLSFLAWVGILSRSHMVLHY